MALGAAAVGLVLALEVRGPDPAGAEVNLGGHPPRIGSVDSSVGRHRPRGVVVGCARPVLGGDIVARALAAKIGLRGAAAVVPRGEDGRGTEAIDAVDSQDVGTAARRGDREGVDLVPAIHRAHLVAIEVDLAAVVDPDLQLARLAAASGAAHSHDRHARPLVGRDELRLRALAEDAVRVGKLGGQLASRRLHLALVAKDLDSHAGRAQRGDQQLLLVQTERIREVAAQVLLKTVLGLGRRASVGVGQAERALRVVDGGGRRRRRADGRAGAGGRAAASKRHEVREVGCDEGRARRRKGQPDLRGRAGDAT